MQVEVQKLTAAASCVAVVTGAKLAGVTASGMLQARSAMTNYRSFMQSCQQLCVHLLEISSPVPIPSVVFKKYPQARPPVIVSGFIASTRLTATMRMCAELFFGSAEVSTADFIVLAGLDVSITKDDGPAPLPGALRPAAIASHESFVICSLKTCRFCGFCALFAFDHYHRLAI